MNAILKKMHANMERYKEISHLRGELIESRESCYGYNKFTGDLKQYEPVLTDHDIVVLCDRGNACFGGSVVRDGSKFICKVYID